MCNGCEALRLEQWPKGALAAICTDVPPRMQRAGRRADRGRFGDRAGAEYPETGVVYEGRRLI